jgi:hypothetical protein
LKYFIAVLAFMLLVAPGILQLWRRRGTFNVRHLVFFAGLLLVSLVVIAIFWPMTQGGGEVAGWGGLVALFVVLGAGMIGALAAAGLMVVAVLMMVRAPPSSLSPPLSGPARSLGTLPPRQPSSSSAARAAAVSASDTTAATSASAAWTAPSRSGRSAVVRGDQSGDRSGDQRQPWYAMVAGIVGIGIACVVIWLYVGFSLAEGQLTLPVGRRHDYTLRGPVAWAAGLALILLTLALLTHALQFIDDRRAKRYVTWRRYSMVAAVVVLGLTVLWQITHRLL